MARGIVAALLVPRQMLDCILLLVLWCGKVVVTPHKIMIQAFLRALPSIEQKRTDQGGTVAAMGTRFPRGINRVMVCLC